MCAPPVSESVRSWPIRHRESLWCEYNIQVLKLPVVSVLTKVGTGVFSEPSIGDWPSADNLCLAVRITGCHWLMVLQQALVPSSIWRPAIWHSQSLSPLQFGIPNSCTLHNLASRNLALSCSKLPLPWSCTHLYKWRPCPCPQALRFWLLAFGVILNYVSVFYSKLPFGYFHFAVTSFLFVTNFVLCVYRFLFFVLYDIFIIICNLINNKAITITLLN